MARRDHAVDAGGAVLPRTAQLMRQSLGLGLGRDLKGLRVRGLRGPPLHDYLADRLPRVEFLLGSVWTDDALRLESRKVATESVAPERGHRRIGAEISIHPFKEILVVHRGRPLQTSIRVALSIHASAASWRVCPAGRSSAACGAEARMALSSAAASFGAR
jgi:hypothetical protein